MKRLIKNNIKVFLAVIISGIVFTGIGVYAASQYFAKDITFTPTNENFKKENGETINNVEDALNELYDASNNSKFTKGKLKTGNIASDSYSEFARYTLNKGNYLFYLTFSSVEGSVNTQIEGCNSSKELSLDSNSNWNASNWQNGRGIVVTQWFECKVENDNTDIIIKNKKDQYSNPYVVKAFANYILID